MTVTTFTREFLQTDFGFYQDQYGQVLATDSLQSTKIPAVPVPLDQDLLTAIYHQALASDQHFQNTVTGSLFNAWHRQPRSSGWSELTVKESEQPHQFSLVHKPEQSVSRPTSTVTNNSTLVELTDQLFRGLDIKLESLRIMKLEPQGWIRPHMDRTATVYGLCYFWIPLHDFAPCLKIFPYGWLQHRFGNMYLFNQNSYVHAAINQGSENRYVMIGRFDPVQVPEILLNQYHEFKHRFLEVWKSNN